MKIFLLIISFIALSMPLSACNTVEGLGQDIERAGEKIQEL